MKKYMTKSMNLMRTIYNMVETLNFMDDAEIFRMADNNLGLKGIKSFIELLLAKN